MKLPRPTIGRLMIVVAAIAVMLAAAQFLAPAVTGPFGWVVLMVFLGWVGTGFLAYRLAGVWPIEIYAVFEAGLALTLVLVFLSRVYHVNEDGNALLMIPLVLAGPSAIGLSAGLWRRNRREGRRPWVSAVLCGSIVACLVGHWPLRLAFLASRPGLERLADRLASGEELAGPERAGVFRVVAADRDPEAGAVLLLIGDNPKDVPSGFVRGPWPASSDRPMRRGSWVSIPVGGGWRYLTILRPFVD